MKIFICWSGARSRLVAESLRKWLPKVIQAVEPFMSEYIDKGSTWPDYLDERLRSAQLGLICITPENITEPWIQFEAGALYMNLKQERVCPYLLDLSPTDIPWPMARFQATKADKDDTKKLLDVINRTLDKTPLDEPRLLETFEKWWPELEGDLKTAIALETTAKPKESRRDIEDMLEETLELVRRQSRQFPALLLQGLAKLEDLLNRPIPSRFQREAQEKQAEGSTLRALLELDAIRRTAPSLYGLLSGGPDPSSPGSGESRTGKTEAEQLQEDSRSA